jgi:hypothetical protein
MSEDWMTPRLRKLTEQFNSAVAEANQASREASAAAHAVTSSAASGDVTGTAAYRRLERKVAEHFRSGHCGRAARDLQERVDRGELTWRQIREGGADPDATRLYLENQDVMLAGIAAVHREDSEGPDEEPPDGPDTGPDDDGPVFRSVYRKPRG